MAAPDPTGAFLSALAMISPGARLISTWPLLGGISAQMTGFEIEHPDGERARLIVRAPNAWRREQNPNVSEMEFRTIEMAREAGILAPKPFFYAGGAEAFYVLEFIEGSPNLQPIDLSDYLDRYAAQLAQVHGVDLQRFDFSFLPTSAEDFAPQRESPNPNLREVEIRQALKRGRPRAGPAVFRHGDFWPGNVLWRDEAIVGVIDWEEAVIGDPLADLAICRLDIAWVFGMAAMAEFTERYLARVPWGPQALPYWDLCASLRPINNLGEWATSYPALGRPDVTEVTMAETHGEFVEQALVKMDLADG